MNRARAGRSVELVRQVGGLEDLMRASEDTQAGSYSSSTLRKYRAAVERFEQFCFTQRVKPLPVTGDVLAAYLESLASIYRWNTVKLHLAAISKCHELCKLDSPRFLEPVRRWLKGAARKARPPVRKARPLTPFELWQCVDSIRLEPYGPRDSAVLLVGYATGMRESELVALDVEDLERVGPDWLVRIRGGKTDAGRVGETAGIPALPRWPCCPSGALESYLASSGITSGALFRGAYRSGRLTDGRLSARWVDRIVTRAAGRAAMNTEGLSGHSLRRGLLTAASDAGCTMQEVARASRHKSLHTAAGYIGDRDVLSSHVLRKVGLG